jgi:hypothetical protein
LRLRSNDHLLHAREKLLPFCQDQPQSPDIANVAGATDLHHVDTKRRMGRPVSINRKTQPIHDPPAYTPKPVISLPSKSHHILDTPPVTFDAVGT